MMESIAIPSIGSGRIYGLADPSLARLFSHVLNILDTITHYFSMIFLRSFKVLL